METQPTTIEQPYKISLIYGAVLFFSLAVYVWLNFRVAALHSEASEIFEQTNASLVQDSADQGLKPNIAGAIGRNPIRNHYPKRIDLADTGYELFMGPEYVKLAGSDELIGYSIRITLPIDESRATLCFQRYISPDELPDGFWYLPIREIVSYDDHQRTVTFKIGSRQYSYQLPTK